MTIKIELWTYKPDTVAAVQITDENMREVSSWCNGSYIKIDENGRKFINLDLKNALNSCLNAHAGDWIVKPYRDRNFFKIYDDESFRQDFDPPRLSEYK